MPRPVRKTFPRKFMPPLAKRLTMIETLVLATDGSESVRRAETVALDLADRFGATVHALYVLDETEVASAPEAVAADLRAALDAEGEAALSAVAEAAPGDVVRAVRPGDPPGEIVAYATEVDADLVAIGTRGRHGEHRFLLGSVAERVVRQCPVPVLSVRQLAAEDQPPSDSHPS